MRRAFREIDGELVHAHYAVPDGYAAARFASLERAPLVLTVWGSDVLQLGRIRRARGVLARTLGEARAIIAVSDELAEGAERLGASRDRLHVIVSGVPYLRPLARDDARAQLGVSDDAVCVLWVGRLHPVKQPEEMIRAFDELRPLIGRDALLVMVGDGPLRKAVRELVHQRRLNGNVRLVGHCSRDATWRWQCAADVLVNSSKSEGTPRAVLEALGAGTPAVGYPLRGVQAALSAVEGGRVAAERKPASLSAAILEELATSRDRSRLAMRARERFAIERTVRAIEDVYESVV